MKYEDMFKNVSVLGAAGKMGSGIVLLTAMEMANQKLRPENSSKTYVLNAVDVSDEALSGLMGYLQTQIQKVAEKRIVGLRETYKSRDDLIENSDVIQQYVEDVLNVVRPTTNIEAAYKSYIVFEAIKEDPKLKTEIFSQIDKNNKNKPWYFTNTSSIPITELDSGAKLDGRILGLHFYNPPAVQKLVEVIKSPKTKSDLVDFANTFVKNLGKKIVPSNDFAGFIGNGHFMRDALFAMNEVERLSKEVSFVEAVYMMNKVSQEYLIRPMGIFQLIDYVGIDVCQYIMSVMNPYLPDEDLHSPLLDKMITLGVRGGQTSSGAQKDGFLKYEGGRPTAIFNPDKKEYLLIDKFKAKCDEKLGPLPGALKPWKAVFADPAKGQLIQKAFDEIKGMDSLGAKLAKTYGKKSKEIGQKLVKDKVANSEDDVNMVMLTGFYHAYGPINNYFNG